MNDMASMSAVAQPLRLEPHPLRGAVLGEVHARPFHPVACPARLVHFGFLTGPDEAKADRDALAEFCRQRGLKEPSAGAKHHYAALSGLTLRWEQHSEFTTYTWEIPIVSSGPFMPPVSQLAHAMGALPQPGPHLVAIDLQLVNAAEAASWPSVFLDNATAASHAAGAALVSTDFSVDGDGFVRWLVVDEGLGETNRGALTQRLLEIETYRTLALLGLPEAQGIAPRVKEIEDALARIARAMTSTQDLGSDNQLLNELTLMAAELEATSATSSYRFAASRAYDGIVQQRLEAIAETRYEHYPTIAAFLSRRMAPAMRTCATLEERQAVLSQKLSRSANLLRTRVDVAIEQQNRDLLHSMNERTGLQLRLQQTVEGLSIAAISYYVVSLLTYVFKGVKEGGLNFDPNVAAAVSVPVVLISVTLVVRSIRRTHMSQPH